MAGLGGELKPFQRAGVSYLLSQRRAFLADEQGLGKTIEALAALQADGAFPAVVVCPASLKLNWLREIERWLPGRRARALAGPGSGGHGWRTAGSVDRQAGWPGGDAVRRRGRHHGRQLRHRRPLGWMSCARCAPARWCSTSPTTARTRRPSAPRPSSGCAAAVPRDGLVLALTGTPVMNRPPELISQLRIVGRIGDFGSGAQFGRRFRGPDAHMRLHWHLRARCFVRRLKADVLPQLPPKTRAWCRSSSTTSPSTGSPSAT